MKEANKNQGDNFTRTNRYVCLLGWRTPIGAEP